MITILKERHSQVALGRLCQLFGYTRQAYYQYYWSLQETCYQEGLIVQQVLEIRKKHPRMGTRKLYELLGPFMLDHQIKMGRDALFDLLAIHRLLIRKRKRNIVTTNSSHWMRKWPNLIVGGFMPTCSNQLWVCDITYWKTDGGIFYISFLTDAYSHKIVGYRLGRSLETIESVKALQMALGTLKKNEGTELIHHSDRGSQYCSAEYIKLLQDNHIKISMTENGDPLENAIAERINGILKSEYLECYQVKSYRDAQKLLNESVRLYNQERPHMSIGNKTPNDVHVNNLKTKKLWKNYYQKNVNL